MPARARALAVAFLATAAVLLATAASAHVTNRGRNDPIASHFHKATGTRILTVRPNGKAPRQITPVPELPGVFQCWDENPCQLDAGTYLLSLGEVIPGLRLTLPAGWSSTSNWVGELVLVPPGHSDDRLFLWVDEAAVKSTGPGHGTTILNDVGTSPEALTEWLTGNPDFHIVTGPERTTIGDRIPVRTLRLNISETANYGDPDCPSNPRCADLFTRPQLWSDSYAIGGTEEIRLYIGTILISGVSHTIMVSLDTPDHENLQRLEADSRPILDSFHLPRCHPRVPGC